MCRFFALKMRPRAFTLVELLVVVAIIAILAAILIPVFGRARENARRSSCQSNLKQIGLGIVRHTQDYDEKFPYRRSISVVDPNGGDNSWRTVIQPSIKGTQLFSCRSNPQNRLSTFDPEFSRSYAANWAYALTSPTGVDRGIFNQYDASAVPPTKPRALAEVTSPSTVIAVTEMWHVPWVAFNVDRDSASYDDTAEGGIVTNSYGQSLFAGHMGTMNHLFADGHVKALRPLHTVQGAVNIWYIVNWAFGANSQGMTVLQKAEALIK